MSAVDVPQFEGGSWNSGSYFIAWDLLYETHLGILLGKGVEDLKNSHYGHSGRHTIDMPANASALQRTCWATAGASALFQPLCLCPTWMYGYLALSWESLTHESCMGHGPTYSSSKGTVCWTVQTTWGWVLCNSVTPLVSMQECLMVVWGFGGFHSSTVLMVMWRSLNASICGT